MKPFFRFPERCELLKQEMESWFGTPFHQRSHAKGESGGVDCVGLVQDIYYTLGAIPEMYPLPDYAIDWHKHNEHSMLEDFINIHYADCFLVIDKDDPVMVGDLLGIIPRGRCIHHAGIVHREGMFAHTMLGKGVIENHVRENYMGFELGKIFRPIEL